MSQGWFAKEKAECSCFLLNQLQCQNLSRKRFLCPSRSVKKTLCRQKTLSALDKPVEMFSCFQTLGGGLRSTFVYPVCWFPVNGYSVPLLYAFISLLEIFYISTHLEVIPQALMRHFHVLRPQRGCRYTSQGARALLLPLFSLSNLVWLCAFTGYSANRSWQHLPYVFTLHSLPCPHCFCALSHAPWLLSRWGC